MRKNNNKVDSVETGRMVIAHLFPWNDQENHMCTIYAFLINSLMPGCNKNVAHTQTNLFKDVWPFCYHQELKG